MDDECEGTTRHGKFAEGTHRFQVTFRASVPDELNLFDDLTVAAHEDRVSRAEFTRQALRQALLIRRQG